MKWDYANLSSQAKQAGGPEQLVESLIDSGRCEGRAEMVPWLVIFPAVASALTWGVPKLINKVKNSQAEKKVLIESEKAELIQGIKDYDSANKTVDD